MQIHTDLSIRATNADTSSAFDTSRHMQKHAKLGIRAYTCRPSIPACTYIVPIHARCIQSHALDKCKVLYVKHERANMHGD
jgi:hypothetical protein